MFIYVTINYYNKIIIIHVFVEDRCELSGFLRQDLGITTAYTVFVLAALTLSFHALCLISAILLLIGKHCVPI